MESTSGNENEDGDTLDWNKSTSEQNEKSIKEDNDTESVITCSQGCGLSIISPNNSQSHNCIYDLRQVVDKQSSVIQELKDNVKRLRKNFRMEVKKSRDRESQLRLDIEKKVSDLSTRVHRLYEEGSRRCHGRCRKHVKTEKCLCQGFATLPHLCCGSHGGICQC